jgi:ribosomal-protein-alanine N-acetyltransferase
MTSADLVRVLEIEQGCYLQPWSVDLFQRELDNPVSHLVVAVHQQLVVGYVCFWSIAGEVEIHNVATAPECQGSGVGSLLLSAIFAYMDDQGIDSAFLEVRKSNVAAMRLYEHFSFVVTAVRKKYYPDGEDALLMSWQR